MAALLLVRGFYGIPIPDLAVFVFAGYLFSKALIFLIDFGSLVDIITGILLILTVTTGMPQPILIIFAGLIGIKAVMSIVASIA